MRNIFILISFVLLFSCGNHKAKEMLKEYQQKNLKTLNFDINDLDFEIKEIKKIRDINGKDSCFYIKYTLAKFWEETPNNKLIDTLTFEYAKEKFSNHLKKETEIYNGYQELVLSAIRRDDYLKEYEYNRSMEESLKYMKEYEKAINTIDSLKLKYDEYFKDKNLIYSTEYYASYSLKNPLLGNAKQTFEKHFYTNKENNKFIYDENVDNVSKNINK